MNNTGLDRFGDAKNYVLLLVGLLIVILIALVWASIPNNDSAAEKELAKIQGAAPVASIYTKEEESALTKSSQEAVQELMTILAGNDGDGSAKQKLLARTAKGSEVATMVANLTPDGQYSLDGVTINTPQIYSVPNTETDDFVFNVRITKSETTSYITLYWMRDEKKQWKINDLSL